MRLIDGDALVESIKEELWHWDTVDGINATTVLKQTISDINNMPTIPQPEIIRCRECKWHRFDKDNIPYCYNIDYGYGWKDDDFCSRAERREVSE
jgi:hypothetical protein